MERLTDYHVGENGAYMKCSGNCCGGLCENCEELEKIINRLAAYEDTRLEPEEYKRYADAIKKLDIEHMHDLLQAENDGRLAVLPCKVGDWVYILDLEKKAAVKIRVQGISISANGRTILHFGGYPSEYRWGDRYGKDWFLTREEAEAALKKREEADNETVR